VAVSLQTNTEYAVFVFDFGVNNSAGGFGSTAGSSMSADVAAGFNPAQHVIVGTSSQLSDSLRNFRAARHGPDQAQVKLGPAINNVTVSVFNMANDGPQLPRPHLEATIANFSKLPEVLGLRGRNVNTGDTAPAGYSNFDRADPW
jgi:hypothetical protein